ncbi:serine O-acetyltransferase EpsC [Natronobacterium gregoryi]|uniref:serine O-acetyltransferase n=2 Tax=Natronobacterium gregoryi TaxID=44930 RepID=L0AJH0_NATGS|nr:serine O-acetyltransferase EpsC [Natronobacterium gregoryi]AFZ74043.1 serine acetyltransferase [Natronobacterium gregoryi SP2]ELY70387.1 serine acetyltransferase [Natronobacterium gregoryi SP2]PLK20789.1 serine acetyltransferase [Natronobacterium gregoryi SP2]SFJ06943.1 serine O-acetyltransferase [Natronobacterium gregoryi]
MEYSYTGDAHERLLESYEDDGDPFPTGPAMDFPTVEHRRAEMGYLRRLFFPRCWNAPALLEEAAAIRELLSELGRLYAGGIGPYTGTDPTGTVDTVLEQLPALRVALKKDVEAAYKGDPAAKSYVEVIRSYPGIQAVMMQRVAHVLYEAGEPEYARELTEYAKTVTGIDVHPGAEIGDYFFIDHGTGVVVGETATIGDWVRLYQDVTLGALHFEEQENDEQMLQKEYERHPDIGDHVVIGAGTKVLGALTVGNHASIGANSWVTEDVPPNTSVFVSDHPEQERKSNE